MPSEALYEALYTPNLVQKRKKWFDGHCRVSLRSKKARLTDIEGRVLAEQFWVPKTSGELPESGTVIQFERFIVELDSLVRTYDEVSHVSRTPERKLRPALSDRRHKLTAKLQPPGLSKEPPLSEVLKSEFVSVLAPMKFAIWHKTDSGHGRKKRKKYHPWGFEPASGAEQQAMEDLPVGKRPFDPSDLEAQNSSENADELEPLSISLPQSYTLDSDLESENEIEVLDILKKEASRKSMFEGIPDVLPSEGPWTKEAYVLFSWHPSRPHSDCLIKSELI